jgi:hypothetical protein
MLIDQVVGAVHAAVLLVGEVGHDELARGQLTGREDVAERRQDHGIHVLHVDSAAAPQHAVLDDALEGIDAPVRGVGGHDVEVSVQHHRRSFRIAARHPRDDARATRRGVEQLRPQTERFELRRHVLGRLGLTLAAAPAPVDGLEADQIPRDRGGLL